MEVNRPGPSRPWRAMGLLLALCSVLPALALEPFIGVLESPQGKPEAGQVARVLFVRRAGQWLALDEASKHQDFRSTRWTVMLGGGKLGSLRLEEPRPAGPIAEAFFTRDKVYVPVGNGPLPSVKDAAQAFGGWMGPAATRPLILVSGPAIRHPGGWKPFRPGEVYKTRLLPALRKSVGKENAIHCLSPDGPVQPFAFGAKDLELNRGYRSAQGQELISIGIKPDLYGCDGLLPPEWFRNWFLLDKGMIRFLGNEWELVDAGDYGRDGGTELLFWHSGYNADGYVLLYDGFKRRATYLWSYH